MARRAGSPANGIVRHSSAEIVMVTGPGAATGRGSSGGFGGRDGEYTLANGSVRPSSGEMVLVGRCGFGACDSA